MQRVVQHLSLVADFVGDQLFWLIVRCLTEKRQVKATGAIARGDVSVHHGVVRDIVVQVNAPGDFAIFTLELTIQTEGNRHAVQPRLNHTSRLQCCWTDSATHNVGSRQIQAHCGENVAVFSITCQHFFAFDLISSIANTGRQCEQLIDVPYALGVGRKSIALGLIIHQTFGTDSHRSMLHTTQCAAAQVRPSSYCSSADRRINASCFSTCQAHWCSRTRQESQRWVARYHTWRNSGQYGVQRESRIRILSLAYGAIEIIPLIDRSVVEKDT